MDFLLRCAVLSLAAFGLTHVVSSAVAAVRWRRWPDGRLAAERADALFRLRLVPTALAAAVLAFAAIGLYRFESRDGQELIGAVLWSLGALGAWQVAGTAVRVARIQWHTIRLMRTWMTDATPVVLPGVAIPSFRINSGFPVVAVVGVIRPRLVIDARVLESCEAEELQAILAHERGHIRRRDNLRRLAVAAVPGLWATPDLPGAWRDATEEAADDHAAASSPDARFHLATALLRVSRLASGTVSRHWQAQLPASALYRGEDIERRVRRLMDLPGSGGSPRRSWTLTLVVAGAGLALAAQGQLHEVMEQVVAFLP